MPITSLAQDAETGSDMPSVELLEFLGQWETRNGDWVNPNMFGDGEFGAILDGATIDNEDSNGGDGSSDGNTDDNNDNSDNSNAVNGADNG